MATVKVLPNRSIAWSIWYGYSHRRDDDPVTSEGCTPTEKGARADFEAVRDAFSKGASQKRKVNDVTHIIQSWSPEESKKLTRDEVNCEFRA